MTEQEKNVRAIYEAGEVVKVEMPDENGKLFYITPKTLKNAYKLQCSFNGQLGGWEKGKNRK